MFQRYWVAAEATSADIIRITGDCPVVDPLVDKVIELYLNADLGHIKH